LWEKLIPHGSLIILEFIILFQGVRAGEMKNNPPGADREEKNMKRPCHSAGPFGSQAQLFA